MFYSKAFQYSCLFALLILAFTFLWFSYYSATVLVIIGSYILNELIWTDHIRYNRQNDHNLSLSDATRIPAHFANSTLQYPDNLDAKNVTVLLEVAGKATIRGYFMDPYVELYAGKKPIRQYFERGFKGKRYINISHLIADQKVLTVRTKYCHLIEKSAYLLISQNPSIENKRLLVLAPHPDDAEIAAFGVYNKYDSAIITITAGESEPENSLQQLASSEAEMLRGQLRSWNSIAVPQWAGIKPEKCIQLGYSDGSLQDIYNQPEALIKAPDKPLFRQFNCITLASDNDTIASWKSLTQDLSELITKWQPDIIITPHPTVDAHRDHQLTTTAVKQTVSNLPESNIEFLYYVNHLDCTDNWPFGLPQSLVAPPPGTHQMKGLYSFELSDQQQVNKACSLEMMHDLRKQLPFKKQIRNKLQAIFLGRQPHPLGSDPYFRKSVRANELFFIE